MLYILIKKCNNKLVSLTTQEIKNETTNNRVQYQAAANKNRRE